VRHEGAVGGVHQRHPGGEDHGQRDDRQEGQLLGRGTGGVRAPIRVTDDAAGEASVAIADYQSEADEDVVEEISERDEVMGESGHRVLPEGFDEEETLGEQLVTDGVEEAAHDQMVEARREELDEERSSS